MCCSEELLWNEDRCSLLFCSVPARFNPIVYLRPSTVQIEPILEDIPSVQAQRDARAFLASAMPVEDTRVRASPVGECVHRSL